jgi:DNA-binding beta-propeller fold protein YncE
MKRFLWLGFALLVYVICSGCGETFRPIIIPNPPTFPNPAAAHTVVSINDNGTVVPGSAMVIDVSGDSIVSVANVSFAPVHAVQQSASVILVVNHSVTGAAADSITKLNFSGTTITTNPPPATISLPPNSAPNFVATTESGQAYVLLPGYVPDPINHPGVIVPSVGVINTNSNTLTATMPVGNNPVAMAETPNTQKLYVTNEADGTISGFNTVDQSSRTVNGAFTAPVWVIARSDSQRLYVLGNGVVSTVDTTSSAGPDTVIDASISVPGAAYMLYDGNKNRLYIPGGSQLTILDVSQSTPQLLATIPLPPFTLLNIPNPVPATATAVAALPDGSRAYVASYAVLPSQFNISAVSGDGTTATYAYTLTAGHDLTSGVTVTVTGTGAGFDGTFLVAAIVSGTSACPGTCFQAPSTTSGNGTAGSGTGSNIFPQVTAVWATSNTIKTTAAVPGFPDATVFGSPYYTPICGDTPFRFMMAAGGDSSRAYLSSCDGGNVNIIDTSNDTYILNQPAPVGSRAPIPPNPLNPPQNPVFLIAGP